MSRSALVLAAATAIAGFAFAADPDLSDYKTVDRAIAAKVTRSTVAARKPGYLGISVAPDKKGRLTISDVTAESPAAKTGVRTGDVLLAFDDATPTDDDSLAELLHAKSAGDSVTLSLSRGAKRFELKMELESLSRPFAVGRQRAVLGVTVLDTPDNQGVKIEQIAGDSAADRAKVQVGQTILKLNDIALPSADKLIESLLAFRPDDTVKLTVLADGKVRDVSVRLGSEPSNDRPRGGFNRRSGYWTRPVFRLGIVCVEYPDVKHNPRITPKAWEEAMFSEGTFTRGNATGQPTFGSLRDYYIEQSFGALKVEGKAFEFVEVSKKRADYATGSRSALLTEALDKLLERDGKDALKDLDGIFFLYAGERFPVPRGSLYWPHRASVTHDGKRWPYFICPEGGRRMANISVFCHEFGHMLGLPDLYARPENPGMEGSGVWSAMANQVGNGKPQHFCAWSKEKLGWIKPTVIDPTVKQKLILGPIEDSPKECFKVLVKPDGSEYLLLENRRKKGFDASLPAEGLLIWRVVGNRPMLEESHGVEGPSGPRMFLTSVPYPTAANDAFTPFTTPSSRSQLGGGLPVYITNIARLADGRIAFQIGYEYY